MKRLSLLAVLAVFAASCAGPGKVEGGLSEAPGAYAALVVTLCPRSAAAGDFEWRLSGHESPSSADQLREALRSYAMRAGEDLSGFDDKRGHSLNRVALRVDARAPFGRVFEFLTYAAEARITYVSLALLQDWNGPWHRADTGPKLWRLDERFVPADLPTGEMPPRDALAVNVDSARRLYQLKAGPAAEVLDEQPFASVDVILREARDADKWRRSISGRWGSWRDQLSERMRKALRGAPINDVNFGHIGAATGDPVANQTPAMFAFLALDALDRLNRRRNREGVEAVAFHWAYGRASAAVGEIRPLPEQPK